MSKDTSWKNFESETTALTGPKKHEYLDYDKIKSVYTSFSKVQMPRFVMRKNFMMSPVKVPHSKRNGSNGSGGGNSTLRKSHFNL